MRRKLTNLENEGTASKLGPNHCIMKVSLATGACFLGIFLMGCSTTTHMFEFYGATHESDGRDFFYVDYSVKGSATAEYTWVGGGHVRDGLVADAKRNLMNRHPLGPNQSYVNMSIDISTTSYTAFFFFNSRVELTATVSADVIQFGVPGPGYALPDFNAKSAGIAVEGTISTPHVRQSTPVLNEESSGDEQLRVGDLVSFVSSTGEILQGEINNLIKTMNGTHAVVQYNIGKDQFVSTMSISSITKVE